MWKIIKNKNIDSTLSRQYASLKERISSCVFALASFPSLDKGFCWSNFHIISCFWPPTLMTILVFAARCLWMAPGSGMMSEDVLEHVQL